MKHLAILISLIILKSCGSSQDVASASNSTHMITNETIFGTYTLEQIEATNVTSYELTLEFDSKTNKVSGFAGCNRFFGTYSTNENLISFSELGATRKMCQNEANAVEGTMFKVLAKINAFDISNGTLSLKNDDTVLIIANKNMMSKERQKEHMNITYRASTRGFFETIWIKGNVLKYTKDRDLKDVSKHKLSDKQLSELLAIYKDLDLKAIPSLEPPSKTFQYDAAAMATLKIEANGNSYTSNGFDHGNPPKAIAVFIDKLLSIKENTIKQ
ncbi:META domain-containing protein [Psychroserpens mesophilus]|uniref:META domain-containing protein n=1 Tax=Psychroserpens mesophilus TaxID=325473 RepID=UPI003D659262